MFASGRRVWLAGVILALLVLGVAGFVFLRSPEASPSAGKNPFSSLEIPQLLDRLKWNLPPEEDEQLLQALVERGRPAAEALFAASSGSQDEWDYTLRALARLRRDAPNPALRQEAARMLRSVFPMKVRIVRTISDEEAKQDEALRRAKPGEMVEYWYNPLGSQQVGSEEVEVGSVKELVGLLAEANPSALNRLTGRFRYDYYYRFEELETELRQAAVEPRTAQGAAQTLILIHGAGAAPVLMQQLKDSRAEIREAGVRAAGHLAAHAPDALPELLKLLTEERHREVGRRVIHSLSMYLPPESAPLLMQALQGTDDLTRLILLGLLRRMSVPQGISLAPIEALIQDPNPEVALAAREALDALRPPAQQPSATDHAAPQ